MHRKTLCTCCLACLLVALAASAQDQGQDGPPKRAQLPKFERSQTTQIFFDDVFSKLVGQRPGNLSGVAPSAPASGSGAATAKTASGAYSWSKLISSNTIEDEVKAINLSVGKNVTTPTDFSGRGYKLARREFSMLAMLFAIVNEYDGDVRWKTNAAVARDAFARAASNAKAGGNANVYKEAKLRLEDLGNLLRGSNLDAQAKQPENVWETIADRAPLMQRLESGNGRLAGWVSSEKEFAENIEDVLHEAEIIAAISAVLTREGMEDGDDEDYAGFVQRMQDAAAEVASAVKLNSADQARKAGGEINKACSECHELYR